MNNTNMTAVYQHKKFAKPNEEEEYSPQHNMEQPLSLQKRKRDTDEQKDSPMDNGKMHEAAQPSSKRRQTKSLFRPWCDTEEKLTKQTTTTVKLAKTSPQASVPKVTYQSQIVLPPAPVLVSPYQLALQQQQQQRQTAMIMQQAAIYQRQMMVAHLWARQQQQQQQLQMHHHFRQQQLFAFGSPQ